MAFDNSIEVNELNFEYEVITFSKNVPVLVDFWAEWCQPCKMLSPILEKLIVDVQGTLRLAKVNIDQNPNLAVQYNVRSIPTVKAFINGQVVSEFVGMQPEARIRDFIGKLTLPSPVDLDIEKSQSLLLSHKWEEAEKTLRSILSQKPESTSILLGLAKAMLAQNKPEEALSFLKNIPDSREMRIADLLKPYATALLQIEKGEFFEETSLDAIFRNSLILAGKNKFPLALDGLLEIINQDKNYRNKIARDVILGILELMGSEDPQTRAYRAELASALF